jgi:hypothetical protein
MLLVLFSAGSYAFSYFTKAWPRVLPLEVPKTARKANHSSKNASASHPMRSINLLSNEFPTSDHRRRHSSLVRSWKHHHNLQLRPSNPSIYFTHHSAAPFSVFRLGIRLKAASNTTPSRAQKAMAQRIGWRSCERSIEIKKHLNSGNEGSEADLIIENHIFSKFFCGAWVVDLKIGCLEQWLVAINHELKYSNQSENFYKLTMYY